MQNFTLYNFPYLQPLRSYDRVYPIQLMTGATFQNGACESRPWSRDVQSSVSLYISVVSTLATSCLETNGKHRVRLSTRHLVTCLPHCRKIYLLQCWATYQQIKSTSCFRPHMSPDLSVMSGREDALLAAAAFIILCGHRKTRRRRVWARPSLLYI